MTPTSLQITQDLQQDPSDSLRYIPSFSVLPCETRTLCCHLEHAKKDKAGGHGYCLEAASGRRKILGKSTVAALRHRSLWRPQEGEPRAGMKSAHEDRRESSVGYAPQESLGLWEGGSAGEASASQLCRRRRGKRPRTGASERPGLP